MGQGVGDVHLRVAGIEPDNLAKPPRVCGLDIARVITALGGSNIKRTHRDLT